MSDATTITECADIIEAAVRDRTAIGRLTEQYPQLTLDAVSYTHLTLPTSDLV